MQIRSIHIMAILVAAALVAGLPSPPAHKSRVIKPSDQALAQTGQMDGRPPAARKKQPGPAKTQIACTRLGCNSIPRGCRVVPERNWDGLPTGFDAIVCPYR